MAYKVCSACGREVLGSAPVGMRAVCRNAGEVMGTVVMKRVPLWKQAS